MCRFLMAHNPAGFSSAEVHAYLEKFAGACERSRTREGDRQEDGWGIAWKDQNNSWQTSHSLEAIWDNPHAFAKVPKTSTFAVHARSASFPQHKGVLAYNQPYIQEDVCYVFNGVLQGVKTPKPIPGKIGAQKIFSLLLEDLKNNPASKALQNTHQFLQEHSTHIVGCNIGLITDSGMYALSTQSDDDIYFSIYAHTTPHQTVLCSENIVPDMVLLENDTINAYTL